VSSLSVLLFGLGLGLRHAADADHVVVLSALVQREPGVWRAARLAALWGAGHTVAFLALGVLIVVEGVRVPDAFERGAQMLVAAMLVVLGLWHLACLRRVNAKSGAKWVTLSGPAVRPMLVGLVHGLAGSAGIALVTATTIDSRSLALSYLTLVAVGTVFGMVALTMLMSRPIHWTMRKSGAWRQAVTLSASLLSVALGVAVFVQAATSAG
jgi:nickel/cobalt transporter (NicO) family protein